VVLVVINTSIAMMEKFKRISRVAKITVIVLMMYNVYELVAAFRSLSLFYLLTVDIEVVFIFT
jgi:hypothetical protein